jgi:hypothetical protein
MDKPINLDGHYFDYLASQKDGLYEYKAYKCRYHSIILYSDNGVPLAALSFRSPTTGKIVMAPRTDTTFADFQFLHWQKYESFANKH